MENVIRPCFTLGSEWHSEWHKNCSSGMELPHSCPFVATNPLWTTSITKTNLQQRYQQKTSSTILILANSPISLEAKTKITHRRRNLQLCPKPLTIGEKLSDISFQDPEIQNFPSPLRVVLVTGRFRSTRVAFWKEPLQFIPTFFRKKFHCYTPALVTRISFGASPELF